MPFSEYVKGDTIEIDYRKKRIDSEIKKLVSYIQKRPHITKLTLKNFEVSDKVAKEIAKLSLLNLLILIFQIAKKLTVKV